jgi:DNA-binding TFAR19-related protein (PDSD5 family)
MEGMPTVEQMQAQAREEQAGQERRLSILDQILAPDARDRLTRLALVKADKARAVEDILIRAAQNGQLKQIVSDEHLKKMLTEISDTDSTTGAPLTGKIKVQIQRRKYFADEGDDDDDSDLL